MCGVLVMGAVGIVVVWGVGGGGGRGGDGDGCGGGGSGGGGCGGGGGSGGGGGGTKESKDICVIKRILVNKCACRIEARYGHERANYVRARVYGWILHYCTYLDMGGVAL